MAALMIFPLILQTVINLRMLPVGGLGRDMLRKVNRAAVRSLRRVAVCKHCCCWCRLGLGDVISCPASTSCSSCVCASVTHRSVAPMTRIIPRLV